MEIMASLSEGTDTDIFGCLPSFILSLMDMGKWYTVKITALLLLGCLDIYNRCIRFLFQPHRKHESVKKAVGKFVYNCFFSLKAPVIARLIIDHPRLQSLWHK